MASFMGFFDSDFTPKGQCYLWKPEILWTHLLADVVAATSLFTVSFLLVFAIRKKEGFSLTRFNIWCFFVFILIASSHVLSIVSTWYGVYGIEGILKIALAILSVLGAIMLLKHGFINTHINRRKVTDNLDAHQAGELNTANSCLLNQQEDYQSLQTLIDLVQSGIIVFDQNGVIQSVNNNLLELTKYSSGDLVGQHYTFLFDNDDVQMRRDTRWLKDFLEKNQLEEVFTEAKLIDVTDHNKQQFPVNMTLKSLIFKGQRVVLAVINRIEESCAIANAEEKSYHTADKEEELLLKNKVLEASNQELQHFAFIASHDLNEPLRKIKSFGGFLKEDDCGSLNKKGQEYLGYMLAATDRMSQLLDSLLRYSHVISKAKPFEPVDLNIVALAVLADLELKIKDCEASVECEDLPTILADPAQMRQLFQNIIENALKYSKKDQAPKVRIYCETSQDYLTLLLEDNGIGMATKYIHQIFEMFKRLHAKTEYSGTGVGLAICRKIVERHGGSISANSELGIGSKFVVTFPRNILSA